MKIKNLTESPIAGFTRFTNAGGGGAITSALMLNSDPTLSLHAASKGYIDNILNAIPASKIISGTMTVDRFPDFGGDVIKSAGNGTINLASSGVGAGSYAKYSVDAKGRIIAAASLVNTDMPVMSWSKIVTGKVTTISGYNITDAVRKNGDTLTGFLTLTSNPTISLHAANKNYADSTVAASSTYSTGDVYIRPTNVTPNGFLHANGSLVSKTLYSKLYSIVGDQYTGGVSNPTTFKLPDFTSKEINNQFYYIKY